MTKVRYRAARVAKNTKSEKGSHKFSSPLKSKAFLTVAFISLQVLSIQTDEGKLQIRKSVDFQEMKVECSERCLSFLSKVELKPEAKISTIQIK